MDALALGLEVLERRVVKSRRSYAAYAPGDVCRGTITVTVCRAGRLLQIVSSSSPDDILGRPAFGRADTWQRIEEKLSGYYGCPVADEVPESYPDILTLRTSGASGYSFLVQFQSGRPPFNESDDERPDGCRRFVELLRAGARHDESRGSYLWVLPVRPDTLAALLWAAGGLDVAARSVGDYLPSYGRVLARLRAQIIKALPFPSPPGSGHPSECHWLETLRAEPADVVSWMAYADWLSEQPRRQARLRGRATAAWLARTAGPGIIQPSS